MTEGQGLAKALDGRRVGVATIVTAGRNFIARAKANGTQVALKEEGVKVLPDLCWCSFTEPLFPPATQPVMTNSYKHAHYGPDLSGRVLRFSRLADCAEAVISGHVSSALPDWPRVPAS